MGRIVGLALLAIGLALIFAYASRAKPVRQGMLTPAKIGAGPFSREDFWTLVDHSATWGDDIDAQLTDLRASLDRLTPTQIVAFQGYFREAMIRSYRWDLWGAAYVAKGGTSDDGFEYFRRWLISRSRTDFERVLADPDALADLSIPAAHDGLEFEAFACVAKDAWSAKTGQDSTQMPDAATPPYPSQPVGTPFREDESYLAEHYPRLWKRYGAWL